MRNNLIPLVILLFALTSAARAQEAEADAERGAVKRVVETYLYAEEGEERKRTLSPLAKSWLQN